LSGETLDLQGKNGVVRDENGKAEAISSAILPSLFIRQTSQTDLQSEAPLVSLEGKMKLRFGLAFLCVLACVSFAPTLAAQTFTVLHAFQCTPDGAQPTEGVLLGSDGSLFGTTDGGGAFNQGAVYRVDLSGSETVLHSFAGGREDGAQPDAVLISDSAGNLYGTTYFGGSALYGTVFRLDKSGGETILWSFANDGDGAYPQAGVIRDVQGNLYGTTFEGGGDFDGTVYKLDPQGDETQLYSFTGEADGADPVASLIRDRQGNLYGTAYSGGAFNSGVVFKMDGVGRESVLYAFTGGADGGNPTAPLIQDSQGNFYGTASFGGAFYYGGVVFKLDPSGNQTVLHSFTGFGDGKQPFAGLVRDEAGNLYGTTNYGGAYGLGVVFKLSPTGRETVLHSFSGGPDGGNPEAGLARDSAGNVYGTAQFGGAYGCGTVFRYTP
jgi:uncharacterized repeat protein (TIGR03803 family)